MSGRETILARVRAALSDVPADERPSDVDVPRLYRRESELSPEQTVARFAEAVEDYGATVRRIDQADLVDTVRSVCHERGLRTVVAPSGFPEHVVSAAGLVLMRDSPPMSAGSLDRADAVITNAAVAIAETGTIALVAESGMGRRALSLVPDVHLCVVRESQVVATVPEAMDALASRSTRPITLISGGSATSDIELVRVEGVHGPRVLVVLLVADLGHNGETSRV